MEIAYLGGHPVYCEGLSGFIAGSLVWIPLRGWMFVSCVCCVFSGRSLATSWSLVRGSPTVCVCVCVSNCVWCRNLNNGMAYAQLGCWTTGREEVMTINGDLRYIWKETTKLLSCLWSWGTATTEIWSWDGQWPHWESNPALPEYKM